MAALQLARVLIWRKRDDTLELVEAFTETEAGKGSDALDRKPQLAAALAAARRHRGQVPVAKLTGWAATGAVPGGRAWGRRGPVHAAHPCRAGREAAADGLRTHPGRAGCAQAAGRCPGQPDQGSGTGFLGRLSWCREHHEGWARGSVSLWTRCGNACLPPWRRRRTCACATRTACAASLAPAAPCCGATACGPSLGVSSRPPGLRRSGSAAGPERACGTA